MPTTTRDFLRNFASHKAQARRGRPVRIQDKDGEFVLTAVSPKKTILGCAHGTLKINGDLLKPTLPDSAWNASL
jgi:hypothetical protein